MCYLRDSVTSVQFGDHFPHWACSLVHQLFALFDWSRILTLSIQGEEKILLNCALFTRPCMIYKYQHTYADAFDHEVQTAALPFVVRMSAGGAV